jgi:3-hydroxyacyl-CoA dehydrogenase
MGHGIAQVSAQSGFNVVAVESNQTQLDVGMKRIQNSLSKVIQKDLKNGKFKSEVHFSSFYCLVLL